MKILTYPHSMEIGGSQLNAIELAAAVRDRGHEVVLLSGSGPLVQTVRDLKLDHILLDEPCRPLSPRFLGQLTRLVAKHRIDVLHGYEWPPAMALHLGPQLWQRTPVVCTVMSMAVPPFLPHTMPLIVCTETLKLHATASGHASVTLIEPPVDTNANSPDYDPSLFRQEHGLANDSLLVVVVGRLANELKLEGLLSACDAIGAMQADGLPVQLAIVGDGPARDRVSQRAAMANARTGSNTVVLTGEKSDPRPAYAAADVLLGMGGSALRSLAFGKPLIVQGELGFWRLASPASASHFLRSGWYGIGDLNHPIDEDGLAAAAARLRLELQPLLDNVDARRTLGAFGRKLVLERFSLHKAAETQELVYRQTLAQKPGFHGLETTQSAAGVILHRLRRKMQALLGNSRADDFNDLARIKATVTGNSTHHQR